MFDGYSIFDKEIIDELISINPLNSPVKYNNNTIFKSTEYKSKHILLSNAKIYSLEYVIKNLISQICNNNDINITLLSEIIDHMIEKNVPIELSSNNINFINEIAKYCMLETMNFGHKINESHYATFASHQNKQKKYCQIIKLLFRLKYNINKPDNKGYTAIYYAAMSNCIPLIKLLLADGGIIHSKYKDNNTLMNKLIHKHLYFRNYVPNRAFNYTHMISFLLSKGMHLEFSITKEILNAIELTGYVRLYNISQFKPYIVAFNILPTDICDILLFYIF